MCSTGIWEMSYSWTITNGYRFFDPRIQLHCCRRKDFQSQQFSLGTDRTRRSNLADDDHGILWDHQEHWKMIIDQVLKCLSSELWLSQNMSPQNFEIHHRQPFKNHRPSQDVKWAMTNLEWSGNWVAQKSRSFLFLNGLKKRDYDHWAEEGRSFRWCQLNKELLRKSGLKIALWYKSQ
jgi:hypothetical protein